MNSKKQTKIQFKQKLNLQNENYQLKTIENWKIIINMKLIQLNIYYDLTLL